MKAVVVPPGGGRFIAVGPAGTGVTVKASDAETGGLCTVWEGEVPAGAVGAGPHYHHGRDEFFYLLDGTVRTQGKVITAGDGYAAAAGSMHTDFVVESAAKYLIIFRL